MAVDAPPLPALLLRAVRSRVTLVVWAIAVIVANVLSMLIPECSFAQPCYGGRRQDPGYHAHVG
eukprot:3783894-Lingulodinium_polyedra.AAC.1